MRVVGVAEEPTGRSVTMSEELDAKRQKVIEAELAVVGLPEEPSHAH